ncbi:hypothetical protein BpHYR1_018347 [Brachionus plicatilis]|uniref:Uncharacterized protein n=1 Tax=Brachionus plicatilis TaxID=10195 RepID=A0A3M7RAC5_BRAPC|nr:hypothetical protein BpHYR1_018347 [Brachionus plicatilis]
MLKPIFNILTKNLNSVQMLIMIFLGDKNKKKPKPINFRLDIAKQKTEFLKFLNPYHILRRKFVLEI